jgi:hypothetical protein
MGLGTLSCPVAIPILARSFGPHTPLPLEVDGFVMKHKLLLAVLIFSFGLMPNLVSSEIYQWVDKNGVQHFTDGPPPPGAERVEGLSETPPDEPQSKTGPAKRENTGAVEKGETEEPTEGEEAGPVGEDGNNSTYRDDYWRRKGWGNDTTKAEGPGPAEQGENPPPDPERTDAIESGNNNTPTERKID